MPDSPSNTQHVELLGRLALLNAPIFVMGGFGEDALLHGRLTKPRADLDLLVERGDLAESLRQLESLGVSDFETRLSGADGGACWLSSPQTAVEVWVCDRAADGRFGLMLPGSAPGARPSQESFRVQLPADTFSGRAARLGEVQLRVVSPLALYLLRETSALTRSRAEDGAACAELKAAFLQDVTPEDLTPVLD